jgi:hypothetical protein
VVKKSGESGESGEIEKWRKFLSKVEKFIYKISIIYHAYQLGIIFIAPSHPLAEATKLLCPHHKGAF